MFGHCPSCLHRILMAHCLGDAPMTLQGRAGSVRTATVIRYASHGRGRRSRASAWRAARVRGGGDRLVEISSPDTPRSPSVISRSISRSPRRLPPSRRRCVVQRGQSGELHLQRLPRLDDSGIRSACSRSALIATSLAGPADDDRAVTVADRQHALHLERHQRLAQGGAAHAELGGQFPLGGSRRRAASRCRRCGRTAVRR